MKYFLFVFLLVVSLKSISQINMGNLGTVTNGCGQNFYDSGGSGGDYGSSQNQTASFCAPAGQYITFTFSQFDLNSGDHLYIYNGPSTGSALIGDFTSTSPGQVSSTLGGCLTFVFTSDDDGFLGLFPSLGAGWTTSISCSATIPPPPPPPPGTCAAAQPFCTSTGATYPGAVGTSSEAGPSYGCLSTQPSPGWFYLNIATNGSIMINLSNSAVHDIDFAIWGPFATQAAMCAGTTNAPIDCSYSTSATETVDIPNAVAGQWYMMLITNYANTPTNISALAGDATGVDGTTNCNILCNMTSLTATPGACVPATGLFDVTGQITLNYPPTSGTLTISSSCGPSTTVGLPWTSPISYTLPGLTANGAACNITATFSADPTCTLTTPITAPASCSSSCTATATNTGPYCDGSTIQLNSTGGGTYSWAGPGGFTSTAQNPTLAASTTAMSGNYTVTVTSGTVTCTATTSVTVNAIPVVSVNSPTICAGQTATLTAIGATTYSWNSGSTANPLSISPAITTNYTVTGTIGTCTNTAVAIVTVNPSPVVSVNSVTMCFGQTATLTATGGTTYSWDTGSTSNPLSVSPATTTSYTVTATALGCTNTAIATVTVNPIPITTVSSVTICPGAQVNLTASGANTYSWNTGSTSNPLSVSPLTTTSYTVTGTSLGCISSEVATVTVVNNIVVNAGVNDSICAGGNTNLNATPNGVGYSYAWAANPSLSGNTIFNPTVNPSTTTTYSVTVTDAGGCTGTGTVTVLVDPAIDLTNITSVPVSCNGLCDGQTLVTPSGGSGSFTGIGIIPGYAWTNGSNAASSTACAGTYTVVVTDSWGCSASNSVTITEPTLLTALITNTPVTCNSFCDGAATVTAIGGTTNYTYSWNSIPVQTSATANNLCAGTFSVVVTDANGCAANASTVISEPSPVVIAPILPISICTGSTSITASASGGNVGGYTYAWTPVGTGASATVTVSPTITSTYTVIASDIANGCVSAPVIATVNVSAPLIVSATGTDSVCSGSTANLIASASGGNGNPYLYSWAPAIVSSSATVIASPTVNTTYTVTLSDGCSVPVTATVAVNVIALPQVNFTSNKNSGCATLCVDFVDNSAASSGSISSWNWNFGDGSIASSQQVNHCFSNPGSYNVGVTVVSAIGACTNSLTKNNFITVFANPTANFTSYPEEPTVLDATIDFINLSSSDVVTWNWNFGDGDLESGANSNPSHFYASEEAGIYEVQLKVSNIHNCVDSVSKTIIIKDVFTFYVPNTFSPNDDGSNETFYGVGEGIDKYKMEIFDRWGNLIFKAGDLKTTWDGRANDGNNIALEDVYVWKVHLTDVFGKKHIYNGIVSLVR